ncbi:aromatase [Amycolatopsis rubida]|uniref:Aromatase n=1 Tax=Amycolatopsis rubida TaxID=112413 RepID=A0ABX0C726_9PSEU|nr:MULTISPECIES: SRPBCC family protein [Amycolatopsis]MYW97963.1 aromatase [Amycolatopsis rubida]NEC62948.1 aromatase [Amycolatopsis rubida]OAP22616.1 Polyketide cyclase / dehydrase and lipid transport [Amycolatopsis sp. M39]
MPQAKTVEKEILVHAPAKVLRDLVLDVDRWPALHRPAVHAEYLERSETSARIRHWAVTDDRTVRTWTEQRRFGADTITAVVESAELPYVDANGSWTFEERDEDTLVTLRWEFRTSDATVADTVRAESAEYLASLKSAAEERDELAELILTFDDPLFIAGSIEDVYAYLYEADKWPDRIPHVAKLELEETVPGIQFFDMVSLSPDGSSHSTRSVRICLPHRKIVYKQIQLPTMLAAHTGHWAFAQTPEGVVASTRHTARIKPDMVSILGEGTTVQDARNHLRRVLTANSMGNLQLAKAYAEERAGF